jgi:hypothetical protein
MTHLRLWIVSALALTMASISTAQQRPPSVVVADASQERAWTVPRAAKPTGRAYKPEAMVFFKKHDARDARGRVVSGLGFITWMEGKNVHVVVTAMVPKPGAPNAYADTPDKVGTSLRAQHLIEFVLAFGAARRVDEIQPWATGETITVSFK